MKLSTIILFLTFCLGSFLYHSFSEPLGIYFLSMSGAIAAVKFIRNIEE